eukprot:15439887-Alexandrium_andersonii.AAC.1
MTVARQGPDALACSAAESARVEGLQWQAALERRRPMVESRLEPDVVTCIAAVSACIRAGQGPARLKPLRSTSDGGGLLRDACPRPRLATPSRVPALLCSAHSPCLQHACGKGTGLRPE